MAVRMDVQITQSFLERWVGAVLITVWAIPTIVLFSTGHVVGGFVTLILGVCTMCYAVG